MSNCTWDIPSTAREQSHADFQLGPADAPGTPRNWSITKRTLTSGASTGVELVEIDNGRLKIRAVPTRGMGILDAHCDGERLGWKSPVRGPVHPQFVSLMEPTGMGWLDGFDELMVRCGLESNGSPVFDEQGRLVHPLHGRIANKPAHSLKVMIDAESGVIRLQAVVDEIRFHFFKMQLTTTLFTSFGSTSFGWEDEVLNLGSTPATMQMLYHLNVGAPLLSPRAKLIAPVRTVSPHDNYPDDVAVRDWQVYPMLPSAAPQQSFFFELLGDDAGRTQVLLEAADSAQGLAIRFKQRELPCFTLWRNSVPAADGYVTGLEPGTNFPNPRPFEEQHGRLITLSGGETWRTSVELDWLQDSKQVQTSRAAISQLQGDARPEIHPAPHPDWSPKATIT
jgi:hypothetical protein